MQHVLPRRNRAQHLLPVCFVTVRNAVACEYSICGEDSLHQIVSARLMLTAALANKACLHDLNAPC